jgi:hypothetical protein
MAAIIAAKKPEEVRPIEVDLERAEELMRASGKFTVDQMRIINETRMHAVWKLGRLLAKVERKVGRPSEKSSRPGMIFKAFLAKLDLNKNRAQERARIGAMPPDELEKIGSFIWDSPTTSCATQCPPCTRTTPHRSPK